MTFNALTIITMVTGLGAVIGGSAYGAHLGGDKHKEAGAAVGAAVGILGAGAVNMVILALSAPALGTASNSGVHGNLKQPSPEQTRLQQRIGMLAGAIPVARG